MAVVSLIVGTVDMTACNNHYSQLFLIYLIETSYPKHFYVSCPNMQLSCAIDLLVQIADINNMGRIGYLVLIVAAEILLTLGGRARND